MKLYFKGFAADGFADFLSFMLHGWFINHVNPEKILIVQNYVDNNSKYKSIYVKRIDVYSILEYLVSHLVVEKSSKWMSIIKLDDQSTVYGLNIKLIDILKLVNFGNMELKPYPIFTKMFSVFQKDIDVLYLQYEQEL